MSLSERLKAAQAVRQASAAAAAERAGADDREAVLDLRAADRPAVDLTGAPADADGPAGAGGSGIVYDPVRNGDASRAFGEVIPLVADRESRTPCPKCGGTTQIDLYDEVHQVISLSCNTCFHMFRVPAGPDARAD